MDTEKTMKQMAEELQVDKQRIYRFVKRNHIKEVCQRNGVLYYNKETQKLIAKEFSKVIVPGDAHQDRINDQAIELLRRELETKNRQIEELNARLAESNAALVAAQKTVQATLAIHAGTMKREYTSLPVLTENAEKRVRPVESTRRPSAARSEPRKQSLLERLLYGKR